MDLKEFQAEIQGEYNDILNWWKTHALDKVEGGFLGQINNDNNPVTKAVKGSVLNARILWTFSAAYGYTRSQEDFLMAKRAYHYFKDFFIDLEFGGVYWALHSDGKVENNRKQIYAIAFGIYGLSEYYKISKDEQALTIAISLFQWIEYHSLDKNGTGYFEAFSREGILLEDLRLSEKDRNDPKTMNTHLHIIEAYANLYNVWKDERLYLAILRLLNIFEEKIIHPQTNHLGLFFDQNWNPTSTSISYGHDIEAAWLLYDCALSLGQNDLDQKWKKISLRIALAAAEGLQTDGSFIHEYDPVKEHKDLHREWWVSAEGMLGFYYAYKLSGENHYLEKVLSLWSFTKKYLLNKKDGEWYWGVLDNYSIMDENKMGFWKCPYHNSRACLELMRNC